MLPFIKDLTYKASDTEFHAVSWMHCGENFKITQDSSGFQREHRSQRIDGNIVKTSQVFTSTNERVRFRFERDKNDGQFLIGICTGSSVESKSSHFLRQTKPDKSCYICLSPPANGSDELGVKLGNCLLPDSALKDIAKLYRRSSQFDYVYFWKRNENIFVHFDWIDPSSNSGYHLDHDGKKVWFLFCRMTTPCTSAHIIFDTSIHGSGFIIYGQNIPVGLSQPALDVEKKLKLLTTIDKNCPLLQLSKRLLTSLDLNQSEYQVTSDGFIRAICYCPTCTTQRKEKTKLTGWVKFYLTSNEDTRDDFRYFRPINKGKKYNELEQFFGRLCSRKR